MQELCKQLGHCDYVLATAAPGKFGDPVLSSAKIRNILLSRAIGSSNPIRWLGYLSTVGVYGDHGGREVSPPFLYIYIWGLSFRLL